MSFLKNFVSFNEHINESTELDQKSLIRSQFSVILKALLHALFYSPNDSRTKAYKLFIAFGKQIGLSMLALPLYAVETQIQVFDSQENVLFTRLDHPVSEVIGKSFTNHG